MQNIAIGIWWAENDGAAEGGYFRILQWCDPKQGGTPRYMPPDSEERISMA